jgi:hypothetical protein
MCVSVGLSALSLMFKLFSSERRLLWIRRSDILNSFASAAGDLCFSQASKNSLSDTLEVMVGFPVEEPT